MGSSLQTCAVSNLPIEAGDDVVAFLLARSSTNDVGDWNGYHGSGDVWSLASMPFYGAYDDSSSIEDPDCSIADPVARRLFDFSVNEYLETVAAGDEGPSIFLKHGGKTPARLVMIHQALWNKLANAVRDSRGTVTGRVNPQAIERLLDVWMSDSAESHDAAKVLKGTRMLDYRFEKAHPGLPVPKAARFFSISSQDTLGIHPDFVDAVHAEMSDRSVMGDRGGVTTMLLECERMVVMDEAMRGLRRLWSPQPGLGGQDTAADLHLTLAEWTSSQARNLLQAERELFGEDDDDVSIAPAPGAP